MYRRFYFRHRPILRFLREMATDRQMLVRRLREGGEFFDYLKRAQTDRALAPPAVAAAIVTVARGYEFFA